MKRNQLTPDAQAVFNSSVEQAYFRILKKAKLLLSTIEQEELRFILERRCTDEIKEGKIVHEIVSPLLFLRLEMGEHTMEIYFGIEPVRGCTAASELTAIFLRTLFAYTSRERTVTNIESSVRTSWFINSCSEMYEYIDERNKYHTFKQIKYRPIAPKKRILSVA